MSENRKNHVAETPYVVTPISARIQRYQLMKKYPPSNNPPPNKHSSSKMYAALLDRVRIGNPTTADEDLLRQRFWIEQLE